MLSAFDSSRRRVPSRLAYARSWRSRQRAPIVKKSAHSLLRGLAILIFDEDNSGTQVRFW